MNSKTRWLLSLPVRRPVVSNNNQEWLPPPPNCLKLNSGFAAHRNSKSFAFGAAIRDNKGKVIVARSKVLYGAFNVTTRCLLALREALLLAKVYNIQVKIAEVDSIKVAAILNSPMKFLGDISFIVKDIKILFAEVGIDRCLVSSESRNSLAFNLASLALSSSKEYLWLDNSPCFSPCMM
ncbi:hypothetical protein EZV62_002996 [Acer yangbiense]|uniref:RNase H type-1 domain-containing protein n=1 Tax=Acer yangbiense TaxID=1000413 RepID=A0A5C7IYQ9_9ROSI|nr:hypothetical protein EZV62_002996 [Acer yangbiense]